jgi:hypothetical protein
MKTCPNCSQPLGFVTIACHQDVLVCPGCKAELSPDNRSVICLYLALAAYLPVVFLLFRNLRGLSFGWAMLVGFVTGLAGALLATWVFACLVRLRINRQRHQSASVLT